MDQKNGANNLPDRFTDIELTVRSILTGFKEGCSIGTLLSEYVEFSGEEVPFRQCGYNSVTELLNSMPNVARFAVNKTGERVLFAVATQETRHMSNLVRRQKSNKGSSKGKGRRPVATNYGVRRNFRRPVNGSNSSYSHRPPSYQETKNNYSAPRNFANKTNIFSQQNNQNTRDNYYTNRTNNYNPTTSQQKSNVSSLPSKPNNFVQKPSSLLPTNDKKNDQFVGA